MKEQLKIEVLVDIEYVEGERENAIKEALFSVTASMMGGDKYRVEPLESKLISTSLERTVEECKFFSDLGQGKHTCSVNGFFPKRCHGLCNDFKQK